jgi:glycosyltransferase involved in cell wall biosynthesis
VSEEHAWPAVSVVVPTRDRPALLRRAVEHILDQRYRGEIDCVVVFDQSPPSAPVLTLGDGRSLRAIANHRTPGLAGARNTGAAAARGEFVAFCDDDDEWLPDKLRRQVEALERRPGAEVAATGIEVHYGRRVVPRLSPAPEVSLDDLLRSRHVDIHPSTILVRREAFLKGIGPVDEAIPGSYGEDYEWVLRAARRSPVVTVQEPLVRVHWHQSSFFEGRWETIVAALQYLLDKYPEFARQPAGMARIYGQIAFASAAAGRKAEARGWARRTLRLNRLERRAYIALAVSYGLVRPKAVLALAHRFGKGI